MKKYILALDQGTTSSRAILFDQRGQPVRIAQKEFTQHFPKPGWVEHDPQEIWSSQMSVAAEALTRAGIPATAIAAIGITNQRETTIVWDRETGHPIHNAVVWQDRRTAGICDQLAADGHETLIREKTGLVIDAYFAGTKLQWLLDNVDGARARAEQGKLAFGTVDSWLLYRLTQGGVHATDITNASRTMLCNIHTGQWDSELLELLRIPESLLPEIKPSSGHFGETSGIFSHAVPITGIAGDQQAALFGQLCTQPSLAKSTYGTGGFILFNTGKEPVESKNKLISTVAWETARGRHYALEGSIFMAGAVIQWLRDGLGLIRHAADSEALAASVSDTAGTFLVPAFTGLGAPHWDPRARGTMAGLTRGTTAAHITRAALESIAYQVADVLDAMHADSGLPLDQLRVDGGAAANNFLLQFQADILRIPIIRPQVIETTALGAAYLAGLAVGYWEDENELTELWQIERTFKPAMPKEHAAELRAQWKRAVERSKNWEQ